MPTGGLERSLNKSDMEIQTEPEKMNRAPQACLRCRKQKVKCNLDGTNGLVTPPCQRCSRAGADCVIVSSRRGARRDRVSTSEPVVTGSSSGANDSRSLSESSGRQPGSAHANISSLPTSFEVPAGHVEDINRQRSNLASTAIDDTFASTNLHNTSDALNLLSQAALGTNEIPKDVLSQNAPSHVGETLADSFGINESDLLEYHLVANGVLTVAQVADLVQRFATLYHPYYPIAPNKILQRSFLNDTAHNEPLLLTAIVTIALRDLPGSDRLLQVCSRYMDELILEIAAGRRRGVDAIETLLLLAEWEPQSSTTNSTSIGCGDEDNAAWMHIGLAIRLAFLLRLDRGYSKEDNEDRREGSHRERLAWAACYLSDRQISVRIGRAFEARDGGSVLTYKGYSFPSLLPQDSKNDNHAKVFQARLELTQIFSNVHDVLYLGIGSTIKLMLTGDYIKYLDDFRASINVWKRVWGSLTCSPQVKVLLQMSFDYLRLYTNAYAFQATSMRSLSSGEQTLRDTDYGRDDMGLLPDARFIYEAVDAAKSLLTTVNNYIPQDAKLCYFPIRFSLYCVNSAVFLYKAWFLQILSGPEKISVRCLISDTIERFRKDSTRPSDLGARYARLLELLWQRTDENKIPSSREDASLTDDNPQGQIPTPHQIVGFGQNQFSWLDLQAVGDMLSGDSRTEADIGMGNMQQFMEASRPESMGWNDMGWQVENNSSRFF